MATEGFVRVFPPGPHWAKVQLLQITLAVRAPSHPHRESKVRRALGKEQVEGAIAGAAAAGLTWWTSSLRS